MTYRPAYITIAGERVEVADLQADAFEANLIDPETLRIMTAPMKVRYPETLSTILPVVTVLPAATEPLLFDPFAWFWAWLRKLFTPTSGPKPRVTSRTLVISRMGFGPGAKCQIKSVINVRP